jgi:hypothetical protein
LAHLLVNEFTSSTSFANPVVTVAGAMTNTFVGIRPIDVSTFVVAQSQRLASYAIGSLACPLTGGVER